MENNTIMIREIAEQPEGLKKCADYNKNVIAEIAKKVKDNNIRHIHLAARGSSDNACNYFKYLSEIYTGIPASFAAPSVVTLYNGKLDLNGTLVIGVSQSGKAADVLAILERAKATGAVTVSITNSPDSPMATAADYHIFLNVGEEKSVAATKTFTAQMYALALLAAAIGEDKKLSAALESVPAKISEVIALQDKIAAAAKRYTDAVDCYVLSRGISYAAAQETALKIQETTYVKARAYAISDFHHGPFAVVDEKSRLVIIAPNDQSAKDSIEMIEKAKATGADITVFTDSEKIAALADAPILLPSIDESVTPFVYVTCAQIFACNLSLFRGLTPDSPRGLKKVTITK